MWKHLIDTGRNLLKTAIRIVYEYYTNKLQLYFGRLYLLKEERGGLMIWTVFIKSDYCFGLRYSDIIDSTESILSLLKYNFSASNRNLHPIPLFPFINKYPIKSLSSETVKEVSLIELA